MRPLAEVDIAELAAGRGAPTSARPLVLTGDAAAVAAPGGRRRSLSISSDAAVNHYETWGLYGASKAALDHVTLTYGAETGVDGVRRRPRRHAHRDAPGRLPRRGHLGPAAAGDGRAAPARAARRAPRVRSLPGGVTSDDDCSARRPRTHFEASAFAPRPAEARGLARDEVRLLVATPRRARRTRGSATCPSTCAPATCSSSTTPPRSPARSTRPSTDRRSCCTSRATARRRRPRRRAAHGARRRARRARRVGPATSCRSATCALTLREPWPTTSRRRRPGTGNRLWRAAVRGDLDAAARRGTAGRSPTATSTGATRSTAYQTVFGTRPGSAEMASAGRPFTDALVTRLVAGGRRRSRRSPCTPASPRRRPARRRGRSGSRCRRSSARLINAARAGGGRVIAVGTTATRALESAVRGRDVVAASRLDRPRRSRPPPRRGSSTG